MLELDPDRAYAIAYNAMLQAARALLFADGYRPAGRDQHVAVVRFVAVRVGPDAAAGLDRLRRKRHIAVYDTADTIGASEAEAAVRRAPAFVAVVSELLAPGPA
ncbi:MAG: HEPN domain-containing protein [Methanospirillum sp.]